MVIRNSEEKVVSLFANRLLSTFMFLLAILPCFLEIPLLSSGFVCGIVRVLVLWHFFLQINSFFERKNLVSGILKTIGTNTMEIYFLHYFLLFRVDFVVRWLTRLTNDYCFRGHSCVIVPEMFIIGFIVLSISLLCILIKKIIYRFPIISSLCFGTTK